MEFYASLIIVTALLVIGLRIPGVLLGGTLFTYQLGAVSNLPWLGTGYVGAATLICLARYTRAPHRVLAQPTDFAAIAIVMLSASSIFWSVDPDSSAVEASALFLSVAGMYGIGRLLTPDQGKSIRAMVWTIAILSPLVSLLLLSQRATVGWSAQRRLLIEGSDASAVGLSQSFSACLLACSILLLMNVPAWRKTLVLPALAVVTYTAVASGTRSVFLAYGFGLLVFFALSLRSIRPSRLLQGSIAVLAAAMIFSYFAPVEQLSYSAERLFALGGGVGDDASSQERLGFYNIAWEQFQTHPLQGVGDGGLLHFAKISYPHNMVLEILMEFGIIGAVVFSAWFISLFREAAYVRAQEPETGAILFAFLVVVIVQHQVSYSIAMARTMFLISAVITSYGSAYRLSAAKKRKPHLASPRPLRRQRRALRAGM